MMAAVGSESSRGVEGSYINVPAEGDLLLTAYSIALFVIRHS
jgi:hypothetical protein